MPNDSRSTPRDAQGRRGVGRCACQSLNFFDEFGFEFHGANAVNPAVDIVVAVDQPDILDFRPDLDRGGRSFDFQILDDRDGVAILERIAVGVLDDFLRFNISLFGPFVAAFRADEDHAVIVGVFGAALGTAGHIAHYGIYHLYYQCFLILKLSSFLAKS